ncbi:hypothetical protein ACLVWQ_28365 [Streptomyces sp. CWNU-52B]|uniref:hypothetical protein n=1 Tax=unclassified Streptomyces TaxID=2593676 RepID=UPI0039C06852
MSHTSSLSRCVVHDSFCRHRLSLPDAVVIVVIAVLACGLSVHGLDPAAALGVLAGAALVATATLTAMRGGGRSFVGVILRAAHAVATP